jgi:hypothetical protein
MGTIEEKTDAEETPPTIGGMVLCTVRSWWDAEQERLRWTVVWEDRGDRIEADLSLSIPDYNSPQAMDKLRRQLDEKVAELRAANPGDFEVECVDATGREDRLDEGLTYMAEEHSGDPEIYWVWDRFGERRQYGRFRFRERPKARADDFRKRDEGNDIG